ncbi:ABC transporter ATP-binding protein [Micromonospora sp. ATA51]|uniref:ABC transporter ATP-binding protein n=1 Tax=Micromonospora sp. ATA51 TaxID=2806098 RepID=UPI001A36D0F6|nr:ABC transporter ATP-binding protein [Micromonospora sp. ATA51]MBM0224755.1 ABC transporter ATP-binding protein [Micromonospora sp. ATA51]
MADIVIDDLVKTYPGGKVRATDAISLTVADGEFLVLVGPSGCGKTTLLRMVAGLETPDSGAIRIGGRDVTDVPVRRRNISMVFQSYAIFPHMKVRQNIGFGLSMRNVPKAEIDQRVRRAAEVLELGDYLDRYPAQLSGGQRQRVAVARAIVVDADVLLMDEPLSNLDALLRLQFRAELKKIVRQLGTTTVYVTHDQAEAMSLGDRIAVMRSGRIAQLGSPIEVYDQPSDQFVGGFLGAPPMNFIPAQVRAANGPGGPTLRVGDQSLSGPMQLDAYRDQDVLVGVRAENIQVSTSPVDGWVAAQVEVVEPTGAAVLLTVQLDEHRLKVQAPPGFQVEPDSKVWLTCPPQSLRFYDPTTGLALVTAP